MKRILLFLPAALAALIVIIVFLFVFVPSRDSSSVIDELSWQSEQDGQSHTVTYYDNKTASAVNLELKNSKVETIKIDGLCFYYMHSVNGEKRPLIIFLHSQGNGKEEFVFDFTNYENCGLDCVSIDLVGFGESRLDESITSLESVVRTSEYIDLVLEYTEADKFILFGVSQGGSVAYHYGAFGNRTPEAVIAATASPNFEDVNLGYVITNGEVDGFEENTDMDYISKNNPVLHCEKLADIYMYSAANLYDKVVPAEEIMQLEQTLKQMGSTKTRFVYYDSDGHDLPEKFYDTTAINYIEEVLESSAD